MTSLKCEVCGGIGARQQTTLGDLPPSLVVHMNKKVGTATAGVPAEPQVRISGTNLDRFATVHLAGETPKHGHYTASVATSGGAYYCDDFIVAPRPHLLADAWGDAYLIFPERKQDCIPRRSTCRGNR